MKKKKGPRVCVHKGDELGHLVEEGEEVLLGVLDLLEVGAVLLLLVLEDGQDALHRETDAVKDLEGAGRLEAVGLGQDDRVLGRLHCCVYGFV